MAVNGLEHDHMTTTHAKGIEKRVQKKAPDKSQMYSGAFLVSCRDH
ncbi:MAG: hypothetical protein ACTH1W_00610 [Advenella sp.]